MADEEIELAVAGRLWRGWGEARIRRSIETAAGSFSVAVGQRLPENPPARELRHGEAVEVRIAREPVLRGFLDDLELDLGGRAGARLSGRDAAADLVDCAPDLSPGEWSGIDLARFARILAEPFGIGVSVETDVGEPFDRVTLDPGQRAWDALEERARYRAVLVASDGVGGIVLTEAGKAGRAERLVEGENLMEATATFSLRERFSEYVVRGQGRGSDTLFGETAAAPEGRASDAGVPRHRPLVLVSETATDPARCRKRAAYEASARAGRGEEVSAVVQGWRDSGGALWRPNALARFESDRLGIHADLLVAEVAYSLDGQGRRTQLRLLRPGAFERIAEAEPEVSDSGLGFLGGLR